MRITRAEELDVILLLDEGDALLTQRTSVQTSINGISPVPIERARSTACMG